MQGDEDGVKTPRKVLLTNRACGLISTAMSAQDETLSQRYVPLLCWLLTGFAVLFICLRIIGYGYLPGGDARRHAAKAFTDRPYSDIVVMRPFYKIDHSPGWEWFLRCAQRATGWDQDGVIAFGTASALAFVLCAPLPWLRRPEAWLAAFLTQLIAIPELMVRLTQARPFVLGIGVMMCLLLSWRKCETPVPARRLIFSFLAFAFMAWMHGVWYLWVLLPPAFMLAGRWRDGLWIGICWIAGSFAGALITGHPIDFLAQQVLQAMAIQKEHAPANLLVGELQPSAGELTSLTVLAVIYLWCRVRRINFEPLARQPVFWMAFIGWALGLFADRFWADWGLPAAVVWMAVSYDELFAQLWPKNAPGRLLACGCIVLPLFLTSTSDQNQRYTHSLRDTFLDASQPDLKGWMPDSGGIFYSAQMSFFYNTFFKNPRGDWRYMVGFEPALLPEDDLKTLRGIQASNFAPQAYQPWVAKMLPADRLEIDSASPPDIPALEWKHATNYIWIGRLPRR